MIVIRWPATMVFLLLIAPLLVPWVESECQPYFIKIILTIDPEATAASYAPNDGLTMAVILLIVLWFVFLGIVGLVWRCSRRSAEDALRRRYPEIWEEPL